MEWQAYWAQEPFGPQQEDLRAGVIAATVRNSFRGEGQEVAYPWDVMPTLKPPRDSEPGPPEDPHAPETVSKNVLSFFSKLKAA